MEEYLKSLIFRFTSPKVPVVWVDWNAKSIEIKTGVRRESNVLKEEWNQKGWELQPDSNQVQISMNGRPLGAGYVVHPAGTTVNLSDEVAPVNLLQTLEKTGKPEKRIIKVTWEGVIGALTSVNIIEKGVQLEPSKKQVYIGILVGIVLQAMLIGPMLSSFGQAF